MYYIQNPHHAENNCANNSNRFSPVDKDSLLRAKCDLNIEKAEHIARYEQSQKQKQIKCPSPIPSHIKVM